MHPTLAHGSGARGGRPERGGSIGPARTRSAFTLIETLLALAIIVLIAALIIPAMASVAWETAAEQSRAEIVAAMSDARSMARARSRPVLVSVRIAADGRHEVWGSVLDAAALGRLSGAEAAEGPATVSAGKRLAVLPERCTLSPREADAERAKGEAESAAPPASVELPEPLQLAVVFPDGAAMIPATPVVLTVPQGRGTPDLRFDLRISPWFGDPAFALIAPESTPPSEPTEAPAESGVDPGAGPDVRPPAEPPAVPTGAPAEEEGEP